MLRCSPDRLIRCHSFQLYFFFNDTATTEIYTLSLHDALPIALLGARGSEQSVTVEEKHPEVRTLINLGKERGYLLYDEIYQALPEELANAPDELDEIYIRFGDFGIEVVAVPEKATKKAGPAAGSETTVPDPATVEKTNDPVDR